VSLYSVRGVRSSTLSSRRRLVGLHTPATANTSPHRSPAKDRSGRPPHPERSGGTCLWHLILALAKALRQTHSKEITSQTSFLERPANQARAKIYRQRGSSMAHGMRRSNGRSGVVVGGF
jgi:hypothetical protein